MLDKIEKDQGQDAAPEDRAGNLSNAKELNVALSSLAVAAAVAFSFGGTRFHVLAATVLALLPVVLIYFVHRGPSLYAIFKPRRDPRTDLGIAFMVCGLGLILGNTDMHFVETPTLLVYAALVGLMCCVALFSPTSQNPQLFRTMIGLLLCAGAFGWGLAATADTLPDNSAPANYMTTVQGKHAAHGRSTTYYLDLAPWGPIQQLNTVSVPHRMYDGANFGDPVCFELRPGALHVQWYQVVACAERSGR